MRRFLSVLVVASALSMGCGSPLLERRVGFYNREFDSFSEERKASIMKGEVTRGMTREQVYLARGVPAEIQRGEESPELEEKWVYCCPGEGKLVVEFRRGAVVGLHGEGPCPTRRESL